MTTPNHTPAAGDAITRAAKAICTFDIQDCHGQRVTTQAVVNIIRAELAAATDSRVGEMLAIIAEAEELDCTGVGQWRVDYSAPTTETDSFMSHIDDSEIDLGQVEGALRDMECQRNAARAVLRKLLRLVTRTPSAVNGKEGGE